MDLAEALEFRREGWIVEEKFDGIRAVVNLLSKPEATGRIVGAGRMKPLLDQTVARGWHSRLSGCIFDGEVMADGVFHVFDLLAIDGKDIRHLRLQDRKAALASLADWLPDHARLIRSYRAVREMPPAQEGYVWKRLTAPYGHDWYKAKRQVTVDCLVIRILPNGVVETLGRGKVVDCPPDVKLGDVIECMAFKVFPSGALRNGSFCRRRPDKEAIPSSL